MWKDVRGKTTVLCVRFLLKTIILPRQARDEHRETSERVMRFLAGNWHVLYHRMFDGEGRLDPNWGKKRLFWSICILKMIDLPRQARDKHRESTQNRGTRCFRR
jgi:hypothetical protein